MSDKIVEEFGELYTAAVADVMSSLGHKTVIDPNIRPPFSGIKVCGRAMTIKMAPSRKGDRELAEEAKAAAKEGDFVVIETGGNCEHTCWGDNSTTAVRVRGAVAVVTDGACRDVAEHISIRFPVYCRMISPGIRRGILATQAYNVPVNCGGVRVEVGDIVLGDDDGVVVVPKSIAEDILKKTKAFAKMDRMVKELLLEGKSVQEAYAAKRAALH